MYKKYSQNNDGSENNTIYRYSICGNVADIKKCLLNKASPQNQIFRTFLRTSYTGCSTYSKQKTTIAISQPAVQRNIYRLPGIKKKLFFLILTASLEYNEFLFTLTKTSFFDFISIVIHIVFLSEVRIYTKIQFRFLDCSKPRSSLLTKVKQEKFQ